MADRAKVLSTDAMRDAKAALAEFAEAVAYTVSSVNTEAERMSQWLSQDRMLHWKREVRRWNDEVEMAKAAIMRKRIIAAPEPASIVDERKALERAQRRLETARRKLENTKRWDRLWDRELAKCRGGWQSLAAAVRRNIPKASARLDRMVASLEAYARLAPPSQESPAHPGTPAGETPAEPEARP